MKELEWLGNSKKNLTEFPKEAVQEMGYALYLAQEGESYRKAKPFKGCGSGVYEIATEHDKNAYRALYSELRKYSLCASLFPKEIKTWH